MRFWVFEYLVPSGRLFVEDWDVWHFSRIVLEVGFEDSDALCFLFAVNELSSHMLSSYFLFANSLCCHVITVSLLSKLQINTSINCLCGDNLRGREKKPAHIPLLYILKFGVFRILTYLQGSCDRNQNKILKVRIRHYCILLCSHWTWWVEEGDSEANLDKSDIVKAK